MRPPISADFSSGCEIGGQLQECCQDFGAVAEEDHGAGQAAFQPALRDYLTMMILLVKPQAEVYAA